MKKVKRPNFPLCINQIFEASFGLEMKQLLNINVKVRYGNE
jgi:hypothetical protein